MRKTAKIRPVLTGVVSPVCGKWRSPRETGETSRKTAKSRSIPPKITRLRPAELESGMVNGGIQRLKAKFHGAWRHFARYEGIAPIYSQFRPIASEDDAAFSERWRNYAANGGSEPRYTRSRLSAHNGARWCPRMSRDIAGNSGTCSRRRHFARSRCVYARSGAILAQRQVGV